MTLAELISSGNRYMVEVQPWLRCITEFLLAALITLVLSCAGTGEDDAKACDRHFCSSQHPLGKTHFHSDGIPFELVRKHFLSLIGAAVFLIGCEPFIL